MRLVRIFTALLLSSTLIGIGEARTPLSKAEGIVAASKRATGGTAWDKAEGCIERGSHADGAVNYLTRFSLRQYGMRTDSERTGITRSMGFDGKAKWQAAGPDSLKIQSDLASLQEAIVSNYLSVNGFYFPDRFPAEFRYLRTIADPASQNEL